jgi:hypothetical protein
MILLLPVSTETNTATMLPSPEQKKTKQKAPSRLELKD